MTCLPGLQCSTLFLVPLASTPEVAPSSTARPSCTVELRADEQERGYQYGRMASSGFSLDFRTTTLSLRRQTTSLRLSETGLSTTVRPQHDRPRRGRCFVFRRCLSVPSGVRWLTSHVLAVRPIRHDLGSLLLLVVQGIRTESLALLFFKSRKVFLSVVMPLSVSLCLNLCLLCLSPALAGRRCCVVG